jgi:hypothetical protein
LKEPALYLAKMASAVHRSGEGLGSLMLSWAQDWAARSGCDSLRWDVWRTNEQLQDYYRSIGGRYIRTVQAADRWSGVLFDIPARRITDLSDCVITYSMATPGRRRGGRRAAPYRRFGACPAGCDSRADLVNCTHRAEGFADSPC